MKGTEIRDLRLAGTEVSDTIEVPEVAFTGAHAATFSAEQRCFV